jgi:hypothetical protein
MDFLRRVGLAAATGYIFFFFSERMFWSFMRPNDTILDQVFGWIAYSIFAYITLILIEQFRVSTLWAIFIVGAAFGWLDEGVVAMTFFGNDLPFPVTIVWTGLAWHALITVLIGWYLLRKSFLNGTYLHSLCFSSALGLFWGVWAIAWVLETPPLITTSRAFFAHALMTTFLLAVAQWLTQKLKPSHFVSSKWERRILAGITFLYLVFVTVPRASFLILILLAAFGVVFFLLRRNQKSEVEPSLLLELEHPIALGKYLCLFAMPFVATLVYVSFNKLGWIFPSNLLTLFVTCAIGIVLFFVSAYKICRRKH